MIAALVSVSAMSLPRVFWRVGLFIFILSPLFICPAFAADWRKAPAIKLSRESLRKATMQVKKPMNYIAIDLPLAPFAEVRKEIEERLSNSKAPARLESRGEAHITVVTPPEFEELVTVLSPAEVREVTDKMDLKDFDAKAICIGRGALRAPDDGAKTWYVVISSSALFKVRKKLENRFLERGGEGSRFSSENYYPHVTVGFVARDLHAQDGVIKGTNSCIWPVR